MEETPASESRARFSVTGFLFLGGAIVAFLAFTLPNLANYPTPSDDEIWILSSSYKLATEGVFGTDLFTDFWNADEIYLFNTPLHHLTLAGVFKVFGTSILAARLVSVVYGVATIILVYVLARRVSNVTAAVVAVVLLLFLRLHVGFDTGLPLQETARSIRYDLAPVPFTLAAMLILLKPTPIRAGIAGGLISIATVNQFFAAFMFPIVALYLLLDSGTLRHRVVMVSAAAVVAILVALPYGVLVLANYEDFKGQTSTLYRRADLTEPSFVLDSLDREPLRYRLEFDTISETFTQRPSLKAALFIALPASLAFLGWRTWRGNRRGDRMIFLSVLILALEYVFIEYEKVTFYLIGIVPFAVIAMAMTASAAFEAVRRSWGMPMRARLTPIVAASVAAALLAGFVAEGIHAQVNGLKATGKATDYLELRSELAEYVPPGSKVLGATQLWWAMPETDFRSYYMLFYRTNAQTTEDVTDIPGYLEEFGAEYVVLVPVSRHFLGPVNPSLNEFLVSRAERIALLPDESFGSIEIWKIQP